MPLPFFLQQKSLKMGRNQKKCLGWCSKLRMQIYASDELTDSSFWLVVVTAQIFVS